MKDKLVALLKSRRFWAATIGLVAVVSSSLFGYEMDTEQILSVVGIVMAWIVGDSFRKTE